MKALEAHTTRNNVDIAIPPPMVSLDQDNEWCVVKNGGEWHRIRFHDYGRIYEIPGLYETLFYEVLRCKSPEIVVGMLAQCCRRRRLAPGDLRVLDLGAGNGMVGERVADLGAKRIVGVDIVPEAAMAARRDRQGVYQEYLVADMAELAPARRDRLAAFQFNTLTCVAALGFGDIPTAAFTGAFNLIAEGGLVAFNIKSDFLAERDDSGFGVLIRQAIAEEVIGVLERKEYGHRLSTAGDTLLYTAIVATKNRDLPGIVDRPGH